jgi:hypothetical protein
MSLDLTAPATAPTATTDAPRTATVEGPARRTGPGRPVARWVPVPDGRGRDRLTCVWDVEPA